MAKVGIVMGSDSDMPVMKKAADVLEQLGVEFEMTIISAHREPDVFFEYAKSAEEKGFKVIIAGAGMAAHLPGMCAAIFPMPVIGIPMHTTSPVSYTHLRPDSGPVSEFLIAGLRRSILYAKIKEIWLNTGGSDKMEAYKQEFIEFMVESDVLKFGEFTLKSGRKSPFFMNAGAYVTGSQLKRLGQYYACLLYTSEPSTRLSTMYSRW